MDEVMAEGCVFCLDVAKPPCRDYEQAKKCSLFQRRMEKETILKSMVKVDNAAASEHALGELRLRALRDEIDDAMAAVHRASEHVRELLRDWK